MNTEQMTISYQLLASRLKVLEDFIKEKYPDYPSHGASGTMTPKEELDIRGWVTPKFVAGVNVREFPTTANPFDSKGGIIYGDFREVVGMVNDEKDPAYKWYRLDDGSFVREDVVTFTKDKPAEPTIPIKAALWPSPVSGYTITTHHGEHAHDGIDLACPDGTPVRCGPNGGYVFVARRCDTCDPHGTPGVRNAANNYGFGSHVVIRYAFDLLPPPLQALIPYGAFVFAMHGHLSMIASVVTPGLTLDPYQKIGEVGSTGDSSGAHLHYALHWSIDPHADFYSIRNNAIDPQLLIKA